MTSNKHGVCGGMCTAVLTAQNMQCAISELLMKEEDTSFAQA